MRGYLVRGAWAYVALAASLGNAPAADFEQDILQILSKNCAQCHGPQGQMAGLSLDSLASALKGGTNGPAIQPRRPADSPLIQRVSSGSMPPALGLDHERLTFRHHGRDESLTDVALTGARVVHELLG